MARNLTFFQFLMKGRALRRQCSVSGIHCAPQTRQWKDKSFPGAGVGRAVWGQRRRWNSQRQDSTAELVGGEAVVPPEQWLPGTEWKLREWGHRTTCGGDSMGQ